MSSLAEMKCVPCQGGEPTVTEEEMADLKPKVPEWQIVEQDGVKRLKRIFEFDDFAQALAFTDQVGEIAEEEGHHPVLVTECSWYPKAVQLQPAPDASAIGIVFSTKITLQRFFFSRYRHELQVEPSR